SRVDTYGSKSAVRVEANPSALAIRGMTVDDLARAISTGTGYQGAGQFDGPQVTFLLQPQGQLTTAEEYRQLVVARKNGAPVYLKDVATVVDGVQDTRVKMRFWVRGKTVPSAIVVLAVNRQAGSNAVAVAQSVRDLIPS